MRDIGGFDARKFKEAMDSDDPMSHYPIKYPEITREKYNAIFGRAHVQLVPLLAITLTNAQRFLLRRDEAPCRLTPAMRLLGIFAREKHGIRTGVVTSCPENIFKEGVWNRSKQSDTTVDGWITTGEAVDAILTPRRYTTAVVRCLLPDAESTLRSELVQYIKDKVDIFPGPFVPRVCQSEKHRTLNWKRLIKSVDQAQAEAMSTSIILGGRHANLKQYADLQQRVKRAVKRRLEQPPAAEASSSARGAATTGKTYRNVHFSHFLMFVRFIFDYSRATTRHQRC